MNFIKNNFISIFIGTILLSIVIYGLNKSQEAINHLDGDKVLYTVCETTDYETPGRGTPYIKYFFYFKGKKIKSWANYKLDFSKTTKKDLKSYVGKKYFVKFSIEKPLYSEICLDKPVPKDFVYEEGQTWEKYPAL